MAGLHSPQSKAGKMTFKSVFISIFLGTCLIIAALVFNTKRPAQETAQPKP